MIITHKTDSGFENIKNVSRIENIKQNSVIVSFTNDKSDIELEFKNIVVIKE